MNQTELNAIQSLFNNVTLTQPLALSLLQTIKDALSGTLFSEELRSNISEAITVEAFALQEVMSCERFYDKFRPFLNVFGINTSSTRSTRDLLILRILVALYDDEKANQNFGVFRSNRSTMSQNDMADPSLHRKDNLPDNTPADNTLAQNVAHNETLTPTLPATRLS